MRIIIAAVTLLPIAFAACASGLSADRSQQISGSCETRFTPPTFPVPPVHRQTDTGTCTISGLGQVQVTSGQDINIGAGTQAGARTFTAANGDELYATHAGTSMPGPPGRVNFSATLTFTGGTGRFKGATGQASARGEANMATGTSTYTLGGSVRYDAP